MSGGIGPFGSKMCVEIVDQFYACRRTHGVSGMVVGECAAMFREMNDCLDREVIFTKNLINHIISIDSRKSEGKKTLLNQRKERKDTKH